MTDSRVDEISRLKISAENYQVRSTADEAVVNLDRWWIEQFVKGPKILELGCADGVGTELLLERASSLDVVDGSEKYCSLLKARFNDAKVRVTNCLYEEFTPTGSFDDIVIARSLEMVKDPVATLARIGSWLDVGGRLHIVVQNAASLHRRIGYALGMIPALEAISEPNSLIGNRRIYTKEMLQQQVESAGLRLKTFKGYFLKPFDYTTLSHASANLTSELIPALHEVGKTVSDDLCHLFYGCCDRP